MPDANLRFIQRPLEDLDSYLLKTILPEVNKFKRSLSKFIFKSPLNFIMVEEDFNQFYQTFYHAKTLIQYAANLITDSSFNLSDLSHNFSLESNTHLRS